MGQEKVEFGGGHMVGVREVPYIFQKYITIIIKFIFVLVYFQYIKKLQLLISS